jgi:PAS domain S-box-containing protein
MKSTDGYLKQDVLKNYENIFNNTEDLLILIDVDSPGVFRYRFINAAFEKLTGFRTDEVLGKTPFDLYGAGVGTALEDHCRQCALQKSAVYFEQPFTFNNVSVRYQTILTPV